MYSHFTDEETGLSTDTLRGREGSSSTFHALPSGQPPHSPVPIPLRAPLSRRQGPSPARLHTGASPRPGWQTLRLESPGLPGLGWSRRSWLMSTARFPAIPQAVHMVLLM